MECNSVLTVLFLFQVIFSNGKQNSYASAGCVANAPYLFDAGDTGGFTNDFTINVDGVEREYILHLPSSYKSSDEYGYALVIFLHGHRADKELMRDMMQMIPQSDEFGYITVIPEALPAGIDYEHCSLKPQGYDNGDKCTAWNDLSSSGSPGAIKGPTCTPDTVQLPRPANCADIDGGKCNWSDCNVDDINFILKLIDYLELRYCIDISREYVTGHSSGGMMSHKLACSATWRFAAVATLHGTRHRGFNCLPNDMEVNYDQHCYDWNINNKNRELLHVYNNNDDNMAMPLMNICGTEDQVIPCYAEIAAGDDSGYGTGWFYIPVNEVSRDFAVANQCKDNQLNPFNNRIVTKSDNNNWNWKCYGYNDGCIHDSWSIFCQYSADHESYFVDLFMGIETDNFILREVWTFFNKYQRIPKCRAKKQKCSTNDECCSKKCRCKRCV